MKRFLFALSAGLLLPSALLGQSQMEIQRAVMAAPPNMRDDVTVLQLRSDGTTAVLRPGTNGLMCWDNRGRRGYNNPFDVQCTTEANRPRLEQNHAFQGAGGSDEEIQARFDRAEGDGSRELSEFGSIYYRVMGESMDNFRTHTTVAVPFGTGESLGLPSRGGRGMLWVMQGGTSSSHLMVGDVGR